MGEPLIVTTPEQLRAIVREEVAAAMRDARTETAWLSPEQTACLLGLSNARSLSMLRRRDGLPAHPVGKSYRYDRTEVESWIRQRGERPRAHAERHAARLRAIRGSK